MVFYTKQSSKNFWAAISWQTNPTLTALRSLRHPAIDFRILGICVRNSPSLPEVKIQAFPCFHVGLTGDADDVWTSEMYSPVNWPLIATEELFGLNSCISGWSVQKSGFSKMRTMNLKNRAKTSQNYRDKYDLWHNEIIQCNVLMQATISFA